MKGGKTRLNRRVFFRINVARIKLLIIFVANNTIVVITKVENTDIKALAV